MHKGILGGWEVVVNNMLYLWNIEATRGQIGTNQNIGATVTELNKGTLAHMLFEPSVIKRWVNTIIGKDIIDTLHRLAMIEEHYGRLAL